MLRSVICAATAAAAATLACLLVLTSTGGSTEDIIGFGVLCFGSSLGLALLVYLPAFVVIRRSRWKRRGAILLTVALLNAPAYLLLLTGLWQGGMFGGWSEVALFAAAYAICGVAFVFCSTARMPRAE
jgi:hypothetical protein